MENLHVEQLFDLSHTLARGLFDDCTYPWQVLPRLREAIRALIDTLPDEEYDAPAPDVRIAKSATVSPLATVIGPAIIGARTEVRPGAYIRGSVLVGNGCVIGNSCELKNAILFDEVQVPHFNYVGDSILGYRAHTGAGAVTSNVKNDKTPIVVHTAHGEIETGLRKLGAMLGDGAQIGCNCVLNPGTVIGRRTLVYPLSSVRGVIPADAIYKSAQNVVQKETRN